MKTMIRIALILASVALSAGVRAEWVEIQQFEDGMRVFVDKTTVTRTGNIAQVLHLVRWSEPQVEEGSPGYQSTVVRTSYDCVGKREKYLASTSYAGPMGGGAKVISDEDEADSWYSISESSMEDRLWKVACGIK